MPRYLELLCCVRPMDPFILAGSKSCTVSLKCVLLLDENCPKAISVTA